MEGRFPYNHLRNIRRYAKQQCPAESNTPFTRYAYIFHQVAAQDEQQAGIHSMKRDEQKVPQPCMYPEQLIKKPGIELGKLVPAPCTEISAVDILPETMIFYLVEPAREVGNEAGFCSRVINHEQQ